MQHLYAHDRAREDAEDLLQELFILAFRNLPQLKGKAYFGGPLKRIVINECIRYSPRKLRWQELEEISFEWVNEEIKKMPQACRTVFNLYALENYSHRQIAETLRITESTSKSQYHCARRLLRDRILKPQFNG